MKREVAAGIFSIIGVAIVAGLLLFIRGYALSGVRYYLILGETMGLGEGAPVRVAGVEVGKVAGVELAPQGGARVCMALSRRVRLYTGYDYTVSRGALLGEPYVRITPREPRGRPLRPGEEVRGRDPILIEDAIVSSQEALFNFVLLARELGAELDEATEVMAEATSSTERLYSRLDRFLGEAERVLKGGGRELKVALEEATRMGRSLERAAKAAERLLFTSGLPKEVRGTLQSVREASESASSLAGSLETLLEAKELWEDLKIAVKGAREVTEEAKATLERTREAVERVKEMGERVKARYEAKLFLGSKPRLSADLRVRLDDYVVGVRDAGGKGRLELQRALRRGEGTFYLGLVQGEPGLGYDLRLGRKGALRLDLYGAERVRADLRLRRKVGKDTDLVVEWREMGGESRLGIGIGYER